MRESRHPGRDESNPQRPNGDGGSHGSVHSNHSNHSEHGEHSAKKGTQPPAQRGTQPGGQKRSPASGATASRLPQQPQQAQRPQQPERLKRSKQSKQPKQSKQHHGNAIALGVALVLLLVGVVGYVGYDRMVIARKDFSGNGDGVTELVRVDEGDSVAGLAPELVDEGIVGSQRALLKEVDNRGGSVDLHQGYYVLQHKMSAKAAIDALTSEENQRGVVDIPNGTTLNDVHVVGGDTRPGIFTLISKQACTEDKNHCRSVDELKDAAGNASLADLGVPEWARDAVQGRGNDPRRLEGLISPGVHIFDPRGSATDILKELVTAGVKAYEGTGLKAGAKTMGLTEYQMLTAASLVERESLEQDFPKVARVIVNRLNEQMKLEFDSTVNYGLDEQEVATSDDDRGQKTPWNTYASEGLPATPIASPSLEAVHAIERPADGDWLYFVTVDKNGTTVFNHDFAAHEDAIRQAQQNGVLDSARQE